MLACSSQWWLISSATRWHWTLQWMRFGGRYLEHLSVNSSSIMTSVEDKCTNLSISARRDTLLGQKLSIFTRWGVMTESWLDISESSVVLWKLIPKSMLYCWEQSCYYSTENSVGLLILTFFSLPNLFPLGKLKVFFCCSFNLWWG